MKPLLPWAKLPEDIADAVLALFDNPNPEVRVEAVRALGTHWRLARATKAIVEVLKHDNDSQVQLSAIGGLSAIGREHIAIKCFTSKILASVVLNARFADYPKNDRLC